MTATLTRAPDPWPTATEPAHGVAIVAGAATPAIRPVAAAMAERDGAATCVGVRWVLDPDDDVACVRALTDVHDLEAGRIVCHTIPGASWPVMVRDLLWALGKDRDALSREGRVRDGPMVLAVWLRAEDVRHIVVLRAHTLSPAVLKSLAGLTVATDTTVWLVWHTRESPPGCPLGVVLQRLTIDATSYDELLTRLHAAQTGFRDEGLSLDLPALGDDDRIAALGPRLDPDRRLVCPTTAAALMLALATDTDACQLAGTSAFWTCSVGRHIRFLGGTYRIPPRARALLRAAVLTAEHPATLLRDRHGRLFLTRRMANLVRRGADRAGLALPPTARPSSVWDRAEPYAPAFTATASITRHQTS